MTDAGAAKLGPVVRAASAADRPRMLEVAASVGLFRPDELDSLGDMIGAYFDGSSDPDQAWIAIERDGALVGVAHYAPERMTDGAWNLYLIAVHPDHQGKGNGSAALRHVEAALRAKAARILLIETVGNESFSAQQAFYRHCGYDEEARIRDFYKAGEDKLVFRKALSDGAGNRHMDRLAPVPAP